MDYIVVFIVIFLG